MASKAKRCNIWDEWVGLLANNKFNSLREEQKLSPNPKTFQKAHALIDSLTLFLGLNENLN